MSSVDLGRRRHPLPRDLQENLPQNFLTLPPNVNGRRRGTLEIRLANNCTGTAEVTTPSGIRWASSKSYPAVEVRLVWWGQQEHSKAVLRWEQSKKKVEQSLRYEILTSEELFRKYLRTAEPVQVRLISARTSTLIGTAQIPVPGKIVNFRAREGVVATGRGEILSGRRFSLGEIFVEFVLKFEGEVSAPREDRVDGKKKMVLSVKQPLPVVMVPERDTDLAVEGISKELIEGRAMKQVSAKRIVDRTKGLFKKL